MDDLELNAWSWRVADRLLAVCGQWEQRFGLDPLLLDKLDGAAALFVRDPHDESAKAELDAALMEFLEVVVENLPDKQ
jgi:hypothetical protein